MQPASCVTQRAGRIFGERCFAPRSLTPQLRGAFRSALGRELQRRHHPRCEGVADLCSREIADDKVQGGHRGEGRPAIALSLGGEHATG